MRPTHANLSKQSLWHNIEWIRGRAPNSKLMLMVKANAYGHGLRSVSLRAQSRVDGFGVATLDEAIILRQCGITKPVHVMQGIMNREDALLCRELSLTPVVFRWDQLDILLDMACELGDDAFYFWIKIQTGLNRLGFSMSDLPLLQARVSSMPEGLQFGWMTHWASADMPNHDSYGKQYEKIKSLIQQCSSQNISINNSYGILHAPEFNRQWVRVGAAAYGINMPDQPLRAVMEFKSAVIQRHACERGESIGYGAAYIAMCDMELAVVSVGYGDGYPRTYRSGLSVEIKGVRCPIVGRVSMDMMVVDVSHFQAVAVGDVVTVWGESLRVDEISSYTDMISYQLVTSVHNRVRFHWDDHLDMLDVVLLG